MSCVIKEAETSLNAITTHKSIDQNINLKLIVTECKHWTPSCCFELYIFIQAWVEIMFCQILYRNHLINIIYLRCIRIVSDPSLWKFKTRDRSCLESGWNGSHCGSTSWIPLLSQWRGILHNCNRTVYDPVQLIISSRTLYMWKSQMWNEKWSIEVARQNS